MIENILVKYDSRCIISAADIDWEGVAIMNERNAQFFLALPFEQLLRTMY